MQITFHFVGCTWVVCLPSLLLTVYNTIFFFFAYWFISSFCIILLFHQYLFFHLERYQLPNTRMYICIRVLYCIVKTSTLLFVLCYMSLMNVPWEMWVQRCMQCDFKYETNDVPAWQSRLEPAPWLEGEANCALVDCPSKYPEQTFLGQEVLSVPLHCLPLRLPPRKQNNAFLINSRACAIQTPQYIYSLMTSCDFCQ